MTIKESLIKWLQLYQKFDIEEFIETDISSDEDDSYAVSKEPTIVTEKFIDGSMMITEYYTFVAKKSTVTDTSRKTTDEFLEEFQDWIIEKNYNYDYPSLKAKCFCSNIAISSGYYLQSNEEKLGMYVFTIEIQYRKEI